jgi:hypothetical protein
MLFRKKMGRRGSPRPDITFRTDLMRCCSMAAASSPRDCQMDRSGCLLSQTGLSSCPPAPRFGSRRPELRTQARKCRIGTAMPRAVVGPRQQGGRQGGEAREGGTLRGRGAEGSCGAPFQAAKAGATAAAGLPPSYTGCSKGRTIGPSEGTG